MATQEFMTFPFVHMDGRQRWEDVKPGWHEVVIYGPAGPQQRRAFGTEFFNSVCEWLEQNVDNARRHTRWALGFDFGGRASNAVEFKIKFRYKRDAVWFKLRWT